MVWYEFRELSDVWEFIRSLLSSKAGRPWTDDGKMLNGILICARYWLWMDMSARCGLYKTCWRRLKL